MRSSGAGTPPAAGRMRPPLPRRAAAPSTTRTTMAPPAGTGAIPPPAARAEAPAWRGDAAMAGGDADSASAIDGPPPSRRAAGIAAATLGVVCFLGALWLIHRELVAYRYQDVAHAVSRLPRARLLAALLATAGSYL